MSSPSSKFVRDWAVPSERLRELYLNSRAGASGNGGDQQQHLSAQTPMELRGIPENMRKRILITGGAGFLGSHLLDRLILMGHHVLVLDDFSTGAKSSIQHWVGHPNFEMVQHDVVDPIKLDIDQIYHLACPASPQHYQANQVTTLKTSFIGTSNMLKLAKSAKARFLLASTSEVYGDPEVTPQKETYFGNVNPIGPRACYDEGKRVAETLTYSYHNEQQVDVRVARIFNTYGPRLSPNDGRVMSNFIVQAIKGDPITLYGEGQQTRSFCFVHDMVDAMIALMNAEPGDAISSHGRGIDVHLPVNLGSDIEFTIKQLVNIIYETLDSLKADGGSAAKVLAGKAHLQSSERVRYLPLPKDDPRQRKPDIERAKTLLGWQPAWDLQRGIRETALYYIDQEQQGRL